MEDKRMEDVRESELCEEIPQKFRIISKFPGFKS